MSLSDYLYDRFDLLTEKPGWRTCLPAGRIGRRTVFCSISSLILIYDLRVCDKSLSKNYIYVGMTNDFERRLIEHNNGENKSTKAYRPFIIIYCEAFPDRTTARIKEKYLKSGIGKEFLRSLVE